MKAQTLNEAWRQGRESKVSRHTVSFKADPDVIEFLDDTANAMNMERGRYLRLLFSARMMLAKGRDGLSGRRQETA